MSVVELKKKETQNDDDLHHRNLVYWHVLEISPVFLFFFFLFRKSEDFKRHIAVKKKKFRQKCDMTVSTHKFSSCLYGKNQRLEAACSKLVFIRGP